MPELPEVETIRRVLTPQLTGRSIAGIKVNCAQVIAHPSAAQFCTDLSGQTFSGSGRRGKFMFLFLENGDRIILHLRMTGSLFISPPKYPAAKHTHLIFLLNDGNELRFEDTRRFGRFWFLRKGEEDIYSGAQRLGLEPFDKRITGAYLKEKFGDRRRAVKDCLMDQSMIAGIGNIYSDEILFEAGIYPGRPAKTVSEEEWNRIAKLIPERMAFFVEKNAVSPEEYFRTKGEEYQNTPYLKVYGHAGERCRSCGSVLRRTVICGRGSVYCPECQPELTIRRPNL